jgi:hypothetical protein
MGMAARRPPGWVDAAHHPGAVAISVVIAFHRFSALLEFGDIWMTRKMLLNIRDRAEQGGAVKDS